MELTTPHTTSTVSAPERHKQQNVLFSRKSASVDSWRSREDKGILVPLDFWLQLSAFQALSLCKKEDLKQKEVWEEGIINQKVLFKYQDYMATKQLICCSEKRKKRQPP